MTVGQTMNTLLAARLYELTRYGAEFLSEEELRACVKDRLSEYYNFLAVSLIRGRRDAKFWNFHVGTLKHCGVGFSRFRLARAVMARFLKAGLHPMVTIGKLRTDTLPVGKAAVAAKPSRFV
jgi:hypothetical protein